MARTASIPISDHGSECTQYYEIQYKLVGDSEYTVMPFQTEGTVEINNLLDDSEYNVKIRRYCCNGTYSDFNEFILDTTLSP